MSTRSLSVMTAFAAAVALAAPVAHAQTPPVLTGSTLDFIGVTPGHVGYDPNAPTSNFSSPSQTNASVAYDVYLRGDSDYVYALLESLPSAANGNDPGPNFENAYLSTAPGTSNVGFSINGDTNTVTAFKPGGQTGYDLSGTGFTSVSSTAADGGHVIEWAMPWSFFTTDPLHMGFAPIAPGGAFQFRRSQSYGYSYTSGAPSGDTWLPLSEITYTPAPEPSQFAALGLGALGLVALALRARKRSVA